MRQHIARAPDQQREKRELLGRELDAPAGMHPAVPDRVDFEIGNALHQIGGRGLAALEQGTHARAPAACRLPMPLVST